MICVSLPDFEYLVGLWEFDDVFADSYQIWSWLLYQQPGVVLHLPALASRFVILLHPAVKKRLSLDLPHCMLEPFFCMEFYSLTKLVVSGQHR